MIFHGKLTASGTALSACEEVQPRYAICCFLIVVYIFIQALYHMRYSAEIKYSAG